MNKGTLNIPAPRRSVDVINALREAHFNTTLDSSPLPNATSTIEKREYESLMDPYLVPNNYLLRNGTQSGNCDESSLGLLDIDKDQEGTHLENKMLDDFISLSFKINEMSGRSTSHSESGSKENIDPFKSKLSSSSSSKQHKSSLCIDDILRDANKQSQAVDEILKGSDNPDVANIRMSLDSYKQSISGIRSKEKESWNFRPDDFSLGNIPERDNDMRDSMFTPANKIDLSKEELSWMREHGDLPVYPTSATFTSGSDKNSSYRLATIPDTLNDFTSLKSNVTNNMNVSKMSVGNYFKRRSENINHILSAPSPEKKGPFPPLFDPENESTACNNVTMSNVPAQIGETYRKSHAAKSLPFHTLSDDSALSSREDDHPTQQDDDVVVLSHVNNMNFPKQSYVCKDITNTVNDETYGSPISCSQIKNFIENYDKEKKSILLDKLLAQNKQRIIPNKGNILKNQMKFPEVTCSEKEIDKQCIEKSPREQVTKRPLREQSKEKSFRRHGEGERSNASHRNTSPTLPEKSSFGHVSNIFHSTKHGEEFLENDKSHREFSYRCTKNNKYSLVNDLQMLKTVSKNLGKSEMSQSFNSFRNEDYSSDPASTLRNHGKSNSGSSGYTESSINSAATVVQMKFSNPLMAIKETVPVDSSNCVTSPNKDNNYGVTSTGMISHSETNSSYASKEILNIMSPASNKYDKSFNIHSKVLKVPSQSFSKASSNEEWVSPMKAKLNNLSKECIPSDTPLKIERMTLIHTDSQFENLDNTDCSLNVPVAGDWVAAESKEDTIIVGIPHDINIKLRSLSSRWILVKFTVNHLHVDGQLYNEEDISQVILLQALASPLLLKVDSQMMCTLKATALVPNKLLKININLNLTDMVTKTESSVKHDITLRTKLPQLEVMCTHMGSDLAINFPSLPQEVNTCIPIILFNNSNTDLPIHLSISCPHRKVFTIGSVTILPRDDVSSSIVGRENFNHEIVGQDYLQDKHKTLPSATEERFIMPKDNSICFKIMLHYKAPLIMDLEKLNCVQYVDAILIVSTVSQWKTDAVIQLKELSLVGGVGVCKLLIQNKQGSNSLMVNQGSSEALWLTNGGTLKSHYKIYIADYYQDYEKQVILPPSRNPVFILDKNEVHVKPGEKTCVNISYPVGCEYVSGEIRRTLAFASFNTTEVFDVIGTTMTRSASQQSMYSVESGTSQYQDIAVKTTKRELSWGSLKIGSSQIKDVAFKNISCKKIRIMASINDDCFKLVGENGPVSSLLFTLLPQECKTLRVEFRPNKCNGFMGALKICHRSKTTSNLLSKIMLHGFGDVSMLVFKDGVFRHGGSQGIPLGPLNESGDTKDIHFSIWNKGTASAFVMMHLDLKYLPLHTGKYRSLHEDIKVIPQCGVLCANGIMRCVVRVPRKAVILARGKAGDTENLATLTILHGDYSTRQRIKRILSENVINESIKNVWNKESQGKLDSLCMHFPEEDSTYGNINNFKESPAALKLLLDELQQKEVSLTYDIDLDNTTVRMSSEFDETVHFHTMYAADNSQDTVTSDY